MSAPVTPQGGFQAANRVPSPLKHTITPMAQAGAAVQAPPALPGLVQISPWLPPHTRAGEHVPQQKAGAQRGTLHPSRGDAGDLEPKQGKHQEGSAQIPFCRLRTRFDCSARAAEPRPPQQWWPPRLYLVKTSKSVPPPRTRFPPTGAGAPCVQASPRPPDLAEVWSTDSDRDSGKGQPQPLGTQLVESEDPHFQNECEGKKKKQNQLGGVHFNRSATWSLMPLEKINRQEPLEWYVQRGDGNRDKTSAGRQKEALRL